MKQTTVKNTGMVVFTVDPVLTKRQIDNRIKKMEAISEQIKALTEQKEALKAEIINGMGGDEVTTEHYVVRNTPYIHKSFDSKKFKRDFPDVADEYYSHTPTHKFGYSLLKK